ncbi:putative fatty acyl CoA syntetase 1 [Trypanosoma conorhini]|uniref:Putative fatty acyl CoA syntetase 1 n=1 Tax=Trypanosoma conorhini TaxID=83891 RepID=A0A422PDA0_9TRYP|nr:putative fatty acyl CoA syntetase 1 [Trypanosoma conorhini]RNF15697.1 putative fatty acyl CoA syntetase 1 [Trypanosoma conorhini]
MNVLVALLKLKHRYSLVPNEPAVQTRGSGPFVLPLGEDLPRHPDGIAVSGVKAAGGETHALRCTGSGDSYGRFLRGPWSVADCGDYDGYSDYDDDDDDDDELDSAAEVDAFATIQESCVLREPHAQRLSYEAMWRRYQCEDGDTFSPLVRDLRAVCMRRRTERAVAWRRVGAVRVTRNADGDRNGGEGASRELHRVSITMERTKYRTYAQLWERVVAFGCGLRALGLAHGAMIGICHDTRWEWLATCYAAWSQRFVCVLFDDDKLLAAQVAAEAKLSVVVCKWGLLPRLHAIFAARGASRIPTFVVVDAGGQPDVEAAVASCAAAQLSKALEVQDTVVRTWDEVLTMGRAEWKRRLAARAACRKSQDKHKAEAERCHANGGEDAVGPFVPPSPPSRRSRSASSTARCLRAPLGRAHIAWYLSFAEEVRQRRGVAQPKFE